MTIAASAVATTVNSLDFIAAPHELMRSSIPPQVSHHLRVGVLPVLLDERTLRGRRARIAVVRGDQRERIVRARVVRIVLAHLVGGPRGELPVADLARG